MKKIISSIVILCFCIYGSFYFSPTEEVSRLCGSGTPNSFQYISQEDKRQLMLSFSKQLSENPEKAFQMTVYHRTKGRFYEQFRDAFWGLSGFVDFESTFYPNIHTLRFLTEKYTPKTARIQFVQCGNELLLNFLEFDWSSNLKSADHYDIYGVYPNNSWTDLKDGYMKNSEAVAYDGKIVKEAQLNTFEVLGDKYAKDHNNVYIYGRIISGADPLTFTNLGDGYAKDSKNVYAWGSMLSENGASTFEKVGIFFQDKNGIYYNRQKTVVKDPGSFMWLTEGWSKFATDNTAMIYWNKPYEEIFVEIGRADLKTIEPIHGIVRDKDHLFCTIGLGRFKPPQGGKVAIKDPRNFHWLNSNYAIDSLAVYVRGEWSNTCGEISGVDIETFEVLNELLARDKNRVYFHEILVKEADSSSFEVMNKSYARDKNHVFSVGFAEVDLPYPVYHIAEAIDLDSFEVLNENTARDKNGFYLGPWFTQPTKQEDLEYLNDKFVQGKSSS